MLCIIRDETDPYFNLAAEEYVMQHFDRDCFMLWRNAPAVIVGRHQNTLAEINAEYVREHNIPVVRRMSGGGAVFHDLGNLNFTFVARGDHNTGLDFRRFTQPILDTLQGLGVDAQFEGRNDLTIDGRKFSGNAEYIRRGRILHHGTLLFSAQMSDVAAALRPDPAKFADKAVKSVRGRVTNISEHLPRPMTVLQFRDRLLDNVMTATPDAERYTFTDDDRAAITRLRDAKYVTWEWNYGYSPRYNFSKRMRTPGGTIEAALEVDEGVIRSAHFYGDYFTRRDPTELAVALDGAPHRQEELRRRLAPFAVGDYFVNMTADDLLSVLI
ncbi:MAG: lipoate--protein ligase [Candidatus Promineofilum sp.]|nr:lipoate--protein ligase [Promineifilum sp.]